MKKFAITTGLALAMGMSSAAFAHPQHGGYLTDSPDTVWRTGFGECWKVSSWTPEKETVACGGAAPEPKPVAKAEPKPKPAPKVVLKSTAENHIVYFDFNSAVVGNISKIVNYISSLTELNSVELNGHADKLGNNAYNQKLSEKRVDAVSSALQAAGVDGSKISTKFEGENVPVKSCNSMSGDALVACLGANRRVEVMISGKHKVTVQQ